MRRGGVSVHLRLSDCGNRPQHENYQRSRFDRHRHILLGGSKLTFEAIVVLRVARKPGLKIQAGLRSAWFTSGDIPALP
jgi:hypothetical protein